MFGQQLVFSANGQPSSCVPQLRLRLFQTGTSLVGAVNGGNIIWKFSFSLNNISSRSADCSDGSSFESCSFYLGGPADSRLGLIGNVSRNVTNQVSG